jgi:serine/threonine protein kinase
VNDRRNLRITIADLGLACRSNDLFEIYNKCGTPSYVAPEVLNGRPFSRKADVFSAGSLFFNLIAGTSLFRGGNAQELLLYNQYENPQITVQERTPCSVSPECKDLILRMVSDREDLRPSAEECLRHPWFREDQASIEASLLLNKNSKKLATVCVRAQLAVEGEPEKALLERLQKSPNELVSFVMAPNYYE